jgi:hypothetical protein
METQVNAKGEFGKISIPKFLDKKELKEEQITDPDYRLKWLEKLYGTTYPISCSKCHHCR